MIATCRNPDGATALKSLLDGAKGKLHIAQIDVADAASIRASVGVIEKFLDNVGLDYLINNAAIVCVSIQSLVRSYDFKLLNRNIVD